MTTIFSSCQIKVDHDAATYFDRGVPGKILEDVLTHGDAREGNEVSGDPVQYLARDFEYKGKNAMAYVLTKYKFDDLFSEREGIYDADEGTFNYMTPGIIFRILEPQGDKYKITLVSDALINNPKKTVEFMNEFIVDDSKVVLPDGLSARQAKEIKDPALYTGLLAAYEQNFLD